MNGRQVDQELTRLSSGGAFGRMQALGLRPRPVGAIALYAAEHCCVEVLHQDVVVRALEIYDDQRPKILMLDQDKKGGGERGLYRRLVDFKGVFYGFSAFGH